MLSPEGKPPLEQHERDEDDSKDGWTNKIKEDLHCADARLAAVELSFATDAAIK